MFRSLLLSCALVALLAGCGLNLGGVSVEFDEALEEELRTLVRADGAVKPLVELLPGDWDTVHIVLGPTTRERIEREVGRPVELSGNGVYGDTYMQDGNLLVFTKSGEIVRMVSTGQLPFFRPAFSLRTPPCTVRMAQFASSTPTAPSPRKEGPGRWWTAGPGDPTAAGLWLSAVRLPQVVGAATAPVRGLSSPGSRAFTLFAHGQVPWQVR
jgi:hypothetical protein